MKKILKYFSFVLILAIPLGLFTSYRPLLKKTTSQTQVQGSQIERVEVFQKIAGGGFEKFTINQGSTTLGLLEQTAQVEKQGEGKDAFVTAINNLEAKKDKREYWAFYINGQFSPIGAGSYQLKAGDKIEWKLASY